MLVDYYRNNVTHIFGSYQQKQYTLPSLIIWLFTQVICSFGNCIPTWWEGYRTGNFIAGGLNWTTDAIAFHWTYPVPKEFSDVGELLKANGMWADIGRYVLAKSGVLEMFKSKRPK